MKKLTIITTTYNRGYCIGQLYDSLCRQKNRDFIWLIIDDGSRDNTRDIIDRYIRENKIDIEYHYKENGGMHTARNLGYEYVKTELNTIIDSDDWLADNAVDKIIEFWDENASKEVAGFIALNADPDGRIIGTDLPKGVKRCSYKDFWWKYRMKGDKKLIYRSSLTKLYPFPEFENETFYPPSYKYYMIDKDYDMLLLNSIVCIVDYNENSMTRNKFDQYRTCAKGFAHYRNETMRIINNPLFNVEQSIHYIAESKLAKNKKYIRESCKPVYVVLLLPIGVLYYYYLKKTRKKF